MIFPAWASLGIAYTGLNTIQYQVVDFDHPNTIYTAKTSVGVQEMRVKGDFDVPGGIVIPDATKVIIEWWVGAAANPIAEVVVDPRWMNPLGSGLYTINVSVHDNLSAAISNAYVTIMDSSDTQQIAWYTTGSPHVAIPFKLNAGTYKVRIAAGPNYAPFATATLVVAADASVTYTLTLQSSSSAPSVGLCTVFDYLYLDGAPTTGAEVNAEPRPLPQYNSSFILDGELRTDTTDVNGRWELFLVQGLRYHLELPNAGVAVDFTVPVAGSASLRSIMGWS